MVIVSINNKKYSFDKNLTVLQACEQAQISIPRFCYHEKLSIAGNCRMCLVEIEKSPKPVASCAMPLNPGMVIFTETPLVKKARESILEFLLLNHPLDCPICDQGGECDLQDMTLNYGSDRSRYFDFKRTVEDKECGPVIKTIMTRCIHCTRCVRFLTELAGLEVFGALGRGEFMEIGTYLNKYLKTELSGNLVDLCPVGALTSRPYAFLARNWELRKVESVDYTDAVGSNIVIHSRNFAQNFVKTKSLNNDQILRILPKLNNEINSSWISDKIRYSFDGIFVNRNLSFKLNYPEPRVFQKWTSELSQNLLMRYFSKKKTFNTLGSIGSVSSIEDLYFFWNFLNSTNYNQGILLQNETANSLNKDLPLFYQFNSRFNAIENSDLILLIGVNPRFESSMLNLRIRKHFFEKDVCVGYTGCAMDLTYPAIHLGNSSKALVSLVEGLHVFCKKIRSAKTPLIIQGSSIGLRTDSKVLQNICYFLGKKSIVNLKTFIGFNTLHANLTQIQICELGISIPSRHLLNKMFLTNQSLKKTPFLCFLANTEFFYPASETLKWFCTLNSYNLINSKEVFFSTPLKLCVEKDSTFLNSEGRLQKALKAITPLNNNVELSDILNLTTSSLNLRKLYPYSDTESIWPRKHFQLNFLTKTHLQFKFSRNLWKPLISNFFMTDLSGIHSKTMAESSLFLNLNSNFKCVGYFDKIKNFNKGKLKHSLLVLINPVSDIDAAMSNVIGSCSSIFNKIPLLFTNTCANLTTYFSPKAYPVLDSMLQNFRGALVYLQNLNFENTWSLQYLLFFFLCICLLKGFRTFVFNRIKAVITKVINYVKDKWNELCGKVSDTSKTLTSALMPVAEKIKLVIDRLIPVLGRVIDGFINGFIDQFIPMLWQVCIIFKIIFYGAIYCIKAPVLWFINYRLFMIHKGLFYIFVGFETIHRIAFEFWSNPYYLPTHIFAFTYYIFWKFWCLVLQQHIPVLWDLFDMLVEHFVKIIEYIVNLENYIWGFKHFLKYYMFFTPLFQSIFDIVLIWIHLIYTDYKAITFIIVLNLALQLYMCVLGIFIIFDNLSKSIANAASRC